VDGTEVSTRAASTDTHTYIHTYVRTYSFINKVDRRNVEQQMTCTIDGTANKKITNYKTEN